jgi:FixJ family two-component response regulator
LNPPQRTVFIVDDDPSVREALASLVRSAGLRVEPCASAQDFLARPRPLAPCCVVLDVGLPGVNGLAVQTALAEAGDRIPLIFITGHADIPMTVRAMKAGATEFLSKPFGDRALLEAVDKALAADEAALVERGALAGLRKAYARLTAREREVMWLVVSGKLNKQAAAALGVSEITVKVHRRHMMRKMEARSLADLVRMAGRLP